MDRITEVNVMARVMKRHPGARFSYNAACPLVPYDRFTVGLPCDGVSFGQVFGTAPTLDLAYNIARCKLDDALDQREAA